MISLTLIPPFDRRGRRAEARRPRRTRARTAVPVSAVLALALVPSAARTQPTRTPDVQFVPTPMAVVDTMLAVARVTKDDRLYDLGSGDGRIVITAAKRYGTRGVGIDIDPFQTRGEWRGRSRQLVAACHWFRSFCADKWGAPK